MKAVNKRVILTAVFVVLIAFGTLLPCAAASVNNDRPSWYTWAGDFLYFNSNRGAICVAVPDADRAKLSVASNGSIINVSNTTITTRGYVGTQQYQVRWTAYATAEYNSSPTGTATWVTLSQGQLMSVSWQIDNKSTDTYWDDLDPWQWIFIFIVALFVCFFICIFIFLFGGYY